MIILKDKKGLTLVEVLVSAVILGIVVISLLGVFVVGRFGSAKAKHHVEAMNHARAAMELLKNNLNAASSTEWDNLKNNVSATLLDGDLSLPAITVYPTGIKEVVVTVSWTERSMGGSKSTSEHLVTLIRK